MPKYRYDIVQGTDEWLAERLGRFTGSDFHVFLGNSQTKKEKLWEKVAEQMFGDSDREEYTSYAMERGHILEYEARNLYSTVTEKEVKEIGIVIADGNLEEYVACSPDGLVDEDGIIEIKSPLAKNFLGWTKKDGEIRVIDYIKPEYKTQVQFNLFVTDRKWCDFIYYHPRGGLVIERIERDEEYIQKIKDALAECIQFIKDNC